MTLLYADVTGSTALTESLDPEDAHAVLYGAVQVLGETVEAHRGTVGRFMGDGLMALFGVPEAFEAHVREACACALAMQSRIRAYSEEVHRTRGARIEVRIGVHAGQVVALRVGDGPRAGWDASGPAVPLAARMEQSAQPGTILLTASTFELVALWFEARELSPVTAKGFSDPISVVELLRPRPVGGPISEEVTFVGRRAELAQIRSGLELCAAEALGHALLVRGEPGIGKTRLTAEASKVGTALGFTVCQTLILDFGQGSRQRPVTAMFLQLLGLEPADDMEARTVAVERACADNTVSADEAVLLRAVLDLPLEPVAAARIEGLSPAERLVDFRGLLADLLQRVASRRPVLFVVEDLHWSDPSTLGFVATISQRAATSGAVVLLTSRPMPEDMQRDWELRVRGSALTVIELGPLRAAETQTLAEDWAALPDSVVTVCIERSGGNPLFLVHLIQASRGGRLDSLPTSVQTLVSSNLSSLADRDLLATKAAAVLGQQFELDALRALTGDSTYDPEPLIEQRLVRPHGDTYMFSHALVLEGVLSTLLRPERTALHLKAADWFRDADIALRAMHLQRAGDPRAPVAFADAAEQLLRSYRFGSARDMAEKGLESGPSTQDSPRLNLLLGEALSGLGQTADALLAFERTAELELDHERLCRALVRLSHAYRTIGRYDAALSALQRAEPIAEAAGLVDLLVEIGYRGGDTLCMTGQYADGGLAYERARRHAVASGAPELIGLAYGGLARLNTHLARFRTVDLLIDEGVARCSGASRDLVVGRFFHLGGIASFWLGDFENSFMRFTEGIDKAHLIGDLRQELVGHENLAMLLVERNEAQRARHHAERALALAELTGEKRHLPLIRAALVHCLLVEGCVDDALEDARKTLDACVPQDRVFARLWAIGALIRAAAQADTRTLAAALAEGDEICSGPVFGYGVLRYRLDAVEGALLAQDYETARRQADALEAYTASEPLPLPSLVVERARLLSALRTSEDVGSVAVDPVEDLLTRLHEIDWLRAVPALERSLSWVASR